MSHRVKKQSSEKNQQILKQLLKEAGNKKCVDCKLSNHPRWASWNLGCFVCIRCSGIHRSMGTHISRVKSVDLDTWTDEQVESMVKWGNDKCNWFWESRLPDGYVPDQGKIENFIRTKYDMKKWAGSNKIPDPLTIDLGTQQTPTITKQQEISIQKQHPTQPQQQQQQKSQSNSVDLLNFSNSTSKQSSILKSDEFGDFKTIKHSPLPNLPVQSVNLNQQAQHTIPITSSITQNSRPDLKKSILSLYSKPLTPSVNSFANPTIPINSNQNNFQQFQSNQIPIQNQWNTVTSVSQVNNNSNGLDDDLFKNVWG